MRWWHVALSLAVAFGLDRGVACEDGHTTGGTGARPGASAAGDPGDTAAADVPRPLRPAYEDRREDLPSRAPPPQPPRQPHPPRGRPASA